MISGRDDNPAIPAPSWLSSASYTPGALVPSPGPAATSVNQRLAERDDTPTITAPTWLALRGRAYEQTPPEPGNDENLLSINDFLFEINGHTLEIA